MKKTLYSIFTVIFLMIGTSAQAAGQNHGRWLCNTCELAPPFTAMTAEDLGEIGAFVRGTVNTVDGSNWRPNDLLTVCDGTSCIQLVFQLSCACLLPVGSTVPDTGKGYRNGQVNKPVAGSGAGSSWSFMIWNSFYTFKGTDPTLLTGTVIVHQLPDLLNAGYSSNFGSSFEFNGDETSFDWGGDFAFDGDDAGGTMVGGTGGGSIRQHQ